MPGPLSGHGAGMPGPLSGHGAEMPGPLSGHGAGMPGPHSGHGAGIESLWLHVLLCLPAESTDLVGLCIIILYCVVLCIDVL